MDKSFSASAIVLASLLLSACATQPAPIKSEAVFGNASQLGDALAMNYMARSPMPAPVVVAPAVKHDGQMRPSSYGEAVGTQVSSALVRAGVPVVQTENTGWTSGQPVNAIVRNRAATANASVVALGSYHHIGGLTLLSYRLVDTRTGAVLAVSEAYVSGATK